MAIVKKEVDYAQEIGDVGEALEGLVKDIKAKKPIAEIAASSLARVVKAVDGIDQADEEVLKNRAAAIKTMGYHTGGIVDAILPAPSA